MDKDKTTNNKKDDKAEDSISVEDLNEAISKDNAPEEPVEVPPESDDLVAKCAEYKAGWQRATADYANLKKEMEKQRLDLSKYAYAGLINELLPTIEHLRKAIAHQPQSTEETEYSAEVNQWIEGIKAIRQQLDSVLTKAGVEFIDQTEVVFDPNIHEAVLTKKVEGVEAGQVVEVLGAGCKLHDKVIKPAKVAVSE